MEEDFQFGSRGESQGQSSELSRRQPKSKRATQQVLFSLQISKLQFLKFSRQLGTLKQTNLLNSVVKYASNGFKKNSTNLSTLNLDHILVLIDNRIQKMRKTKSLKKNWGQEDLKILIWLVSKYCQFKKIKHHEKQLDIQDWRFIATLIPGVSADSCMFKWLSLKTVSLTECNWTSQQSQILKGLVKARKPYHTKHCSQIKDWREISKQLYNLNKHPNKHYRNPKQCRQHWTCYLSNNIRKGPWTLQQDIKLFTFLQNNKGGRKWSQIVKYFDHRTQNALKNRYTLIIQKLQKKYQKIYTEPQLIKIFVQQNYINQMTTETTTPQAQQISQSPSQKEQSYFDNYYNNQQSIKLEQQQKTDKKLQVKVVDMTKLQYFSCDYLLGLQPGFLDMNGSFTRIQKKYSFPMQDHEDQSYSNDLMLF